MLLKNKQGIRESIISYKTSVPVKKFVLVEQDNTGLYLIAKACIV